MIIEASIPAQPPTPTKYLSWDNVTRLDFIKTLTVSLEAEVPKNVHFDEAVVRINIIANSATISICDPIVKRVAVDAILRALKDYGTLQDTSDLTVIQLEVEWYSSKSARKSLGDGTPRYEITLESP